MFMSLSLFKIPRFLWKFNFTTRAIDPQTALQYTPCGVHYKYQSEEEEEENNKLWSVMAILVTTL